MRPFPHLALVISLSMLLACGGEGDGGSGRTPPAARPKVALLAWNDLGMHCYNPDFSDLAILPPYNTLWAQVIRVGDPPAVVTDGITIRYRFKDNTYSAGKTNFWTYAQPLFGLSEPLPPNVGLKGKGLSGVMDARGDHFIAEGIPLTEFRDSALATPDCYQLAVITAEDTATGEVLARTTIVAPISSELRCDTCHSDTGDATTRYPIVPTGKVETNILALHDYLNQGKYEGALLDRRPVLCAQCHSSNALGAPGVQGVSSLSNAMHRHHKNLPDITPDTNGCYNCHPGPNTKCLRDTMSQNFGMSCVDCHGDVASVSENPSPWLNEPRCDAEACHGAGFALDKPLYRQSKGHGGTYCPACHDSPHAVGPSREARDDVKFVALQGFRGSLRACTVCHATEPGKAFHHSPSPAP